MPKNITIALIFFLITLIAVYIFYQKKNKTNFSNIDISIKNQIYHLEIAHTLTQKSVGLSNRDKLCQNCGMIFIFNQNKNLPFWMKDTLIPLDIIWINSQGQITDIITATNINSTNILQNTQPAQYVIELNAGDAIKLNLKTNDYIQLPNLNDQ